MRVVKFLFFFFAFLTIMSCNDDDELQQLKTAYHLMDVDSIDDAELIVNMYNDSKKDDETQAFFNLAKTRLLYINEKEPDNDSLINYSVNYYKNIKADNNMLAEAYYYKGVIMLSRGDEEGIKNLKEAEILANEAENVNLQYKVSEYLSSVYLSLNMYQLGGEYARKTYNLAKIEKNVNWIAYSALNLSTYYMSIDNQDSVQHYMDIITPCIKKIDKNDLPGFYVNLGINIQYQDKNKAIEYYNEAIKIKPISEAYFNLAKLYNEYNELDSATIMLNKALRGATLSDSIYVYTELSNINFKLDNYKSAYKYLLLKDDIQEKQNEIERNNNMMRVNAQYDVLKKEREYQSIIQKVTAVVVLLILISIGLFFYNSLRMLRMKKDQLRDQLLIEVYNSKISELETSEQNSTNQVARLKKQVEKIKRRQGERFSEGKKLYDSLVNNESIIEWSKVDYSNFFDYYYVLDMTFMEHIFKDYYTLSDRAMLYLVLTNMDKTEEQIEKIFGLSKSSIRSIKSRVNSKLKKEEA